MADVTSLIARPPVINFDQLGDPFRSYTDARNQRTGWELENTRKMSLANLPRLPDGTPNFAEAFDRLSSGGDFEGAMKIAPLARQQVVDAQTLQASQDFSNLFRPGGALGGGAQPNAVPAPQVPPVAQPPRPASPVADNMTIPDRQVAAANAPETPVVFGDGSVGTPSTLPPPGAPPAGPAPASIPTSPGITSGPRPVGAQYQPTPPTVQPPTAPAAPAPPPVPGQAANPALANVGALVAAASNPRLAQAQRDIAKTMLEHALKSSDLPEVQKNYLLYRAQGGTEDFTTWDRGNKAAGATKVNVDQRGETKFDEAFGAAQAKRWNGYIENAQQAQRKLVDLQQMRSISNDAGNPGAQATVKEFLGPYAAAIGINIEGLPGIQAYSSIIQRLAPQQRVPGSGSTSDVEFKGMIRSMPGLMNHPEAREIVLDTMEAITRMEVAEGEIATRLATKDITRAQAEKELRDLGDPMKRFSAWRKANPEIYGQALKTGTAPGGQTGGWIQDGNIRYRVKQ